MEKRVERLCRQLAERNLDALLVSQPENRRYLSGFTGSAGYLMISPRERLLLVDSRYTEQAGRQSPQFQVHQVTGRPEEDLPPFVAQVGGARWGFESAHITVSLYDKLRPVFEQAGIELVAQEGLVENLRAVKDEAELGFLRQAIALTDAAFAHTLDWIRPGVTEKAVSWEIQKYIYEHGGEGLSFDTIVGSGPNGAMPHHGCGDRPIQAGEPIVIDMGAIVGGYHADMTRTICLGEPDERFWEIYNLVRQAQERAATGLYAGITGIAGDQLARQVIVDAGYGDNFGHGLGHGVGLATHELPRLSAVAEEPLSAGMAVTVEPGIYLPGWGGVRIEDIVLVTDGGSEILTASTKDPVVLL